MATYENEILGAPVGVNTGKDFILSLSDVGIVDVYQETLVGGVDYIVAALGASNGQTMLDPALVVWDGAENLIQYEPDSAVLGGRDPFFFFRPPNLGFGQISTYYFGVFDQAGQGGSYTLSVEGAGSPVFFGTPGTVFL